MSIYQLYKNKVSLVAFTIIVLFCIVTIKPFLNWLPEYNHPFIYDTDQYYSYLILAFKHRDLALVNGTYGFWLTKTNIGELVPKGTYGMSLVYLPFFLIAELCSAKNATGYEPIYGWSIHIGCIIYSLIGLWFSRKILLNYFNEKTTAICLFVLFFGTNLFCYTLINSELTHGILFFLISTFIYCSINWYTNNKPKHFLCLCFLLGLITLIRPSEIIIVIIPLLIGVASYNTFIQKLKTIANLKWFLVVGFILFMIPVFPQLLYWKMQSGQWFFFSYGSNEHFYFNDPQFFNVLFSYRKGWLLYTPLMLLSLIGFLFLYKKNKALFYSTSIYFLLNLYIISSWWDWTYGGSFGCRALVQTYAVLVIPMGYFITYIYDSLSSKSLKIITSFFILFFCFLNVFQSNLYKHGIISYDGMTKEAYWFTFLKKNYSKEDLVYLNILIKHPDYQAMSNGNRDN